VRNAVIPSHEWSRVDNTRGPTGAHGIACACTCRSGRSRALLVSFSQGTRTAARKARARLVPQVMRGVMRTLMDSCKRPYHADFPVGTLVQIADRTILERFKEEWKYHHPLNNEQLECAGRIAAVSKLGFYHGGDVLYELEELPGFWHEVCLLKQHGAHDA
jgi:hypothetical protein